MICAVVRMSDSCHPEHFITFVFPFPHEIAVGDDRLFFQGSTDIDRTDKVEEACAVIFRNIAFGIFCEDFMKGKLRSLCGGDVILVLIAVADAVIRIQIDIIDTPVIGSKRRDHVILLGAHFLLFQQLILQRNAFLQLLLHQLRGLLFQCQAGGLSHLCNNQREHGDQHHGREEREDEASLDNPVRYG